VNYLLRRYAYEARDAEALRKKKLETEEKDKQLKSEIEAEKELLNLELDKGIDWDDYTPPLIKEPQVKTHHNKKKFTAGDELKLQSLTNFINEFTVYKIAEDDKFSPQEMRCNQTQFLDALKKWETKRGEFLWKGLERISNSENFWNSEERKCICQLLKRGGQNNKDKDFFTDFLKKIDC